MRSRLLPLRITRRRCLLVLAAAGSVAPWALAQPGPAPLELNHATQAELEQLPGLGPSLSEQLLATRRAQGPFQDWADLIGRLKGVGPAKARRWSDAGLRIGGQAFEATPPR